MLGNRKMSHTTKLIALCAIVAYIIIFAAIFVFTPIFDEPENEDGYGDLTGRFLPKPSMSYKGQEYVFRSSDVENILVLGVDGKRGIGKEARLRGQSDFMMLLSVNKRNKLITPIIIDRDTMAAVQLYGIFGDPAGTDVMQICLAHSFSNDDVTGGQNAVQAVSALLGELPIEHYITMDIPGIVLLNDAVGGIEITLQDDFSQLDPAMRTGETLVLKGEQAELFVRGRMGLLYGTNHFRVQRQTQYLSPMINKLSALIRQDSDIVNTLLDTLDTHIESSLSRAEIIRSAHSFSGYEHTTPVILQGESRLGTDKSMEFWLDWDSTARLLIDICYEKKE